MIDLVLEPDLEAGALPCRCAGDSPFCRWKQVVLSQGVPELSDSPRVIMMGKTHSTNANPWFFWICGGKGEGRSAPRVSTPRLDNERPLGYIKIHLRDLTLIVISRPGYHTVLVQGPARTKRSSLARKYSKGGDSCVYSRKLSGAPSYVGRHCAPEQACSIWSSCLVLGLDRSVLVQAKRATIDCKGGGGAKSLTW